MANSIASKHETSRTEKTTAPVAKDNAHIEGVQTTPAPIAEAAERDETLGGISATDSELKEDVKEGPKGDTDNAPAAVPVPSSGPKRDGGASIRLEYAGREYTGPVVATPEGIAKTILSFKLPWVKSKILVTLHADGKEYTHAVLPKDGKMIVSKPLRAMYFGKRLLALNEQYGK